MVLCGLGMQQCAMHNATIQKTTFFESGVIFLFITLHIILLKFQSFQNIWKSLKIFDFFKSCQLLKIFENFRKVFGVFRKVFVNFRKLSAIVIFSSEIPNVVS